MPTAEVATSGAGLLWDLVDESLDEGAFLWRRWEEGLAEHGHDLDHLSYWTEERLLGSLDGLRVAGDEAIDRLLVPALASDDLARVRVAAYTMAATASRGANEVLANAVLAASGERLSALRRGVELCEGWGVVKALEPRLDGAPAEIRAAVLDVYTFRRADPGVGHLPLLAGSDPGLKRAALRAARFAPRAIARSYAEQGLALDDPAARNQAVETGLVLGTRQARSRCRELVSEQDAHCGPLLVLTALLGSKDDHAKLFTAVGNEKLRRDAVWALGFSGRAAAADLCADLLRQGLATRLAAEALCAITGLDLETAGLTVAPLPENDEPIPFESEDLDADLVASPDELLPDPDVPGVLRWWQAQRARFRSDERYLGGRPVDWNVLQSALERGNLRRRHATALELAVRSEGLYQVTTTAFTAEQRRQMNGFRSIAAAALPRSALGDWSAL